MGCCGTKRNVPGVTPRVELPRQETIIAQGEKLIPFSQKTSKELDSILNANATSGRMSVPQLKKALGVLELDPQVFTDPDTQVYKFLNRLQNEKKLYDIQKLSLCSILLGGGDIQTKARLLFNHFDTDSSAKLEAGELKHMLDEMIEISVRLIPILSLKVEDETDGGVQKLTQEEINDYTEILEKHQGKFVENIMTKLLGGATAITIEEFIQRVGSDDYLKRIVWSSNIRVTLYEMSKGVTLN